MLADLLRPLAPGLAEGFGDVLAPPAFISHIASYSYGGDEWHPALADRTARVVILAGPLATRCAPAVYALAGRIGAPVANTWGAKGIYPWDDSHHMGTCGLQRDDFALLGFADFDLIVGIGIDDDESRHEHVALTPYIVVAAEAGRLNTLCKRAAPRSPLPSGNDLYRRMAAIAQPGYLDQSVPRHPARAVIDLKQSLGPTTRVTVQPGLAGLWVARTFPTDRMGSVIVPAQDRPGIGAAVGLASAAQHTDTVCVVHGPVDEVTAEVMRVAAHHELPLRLEVWDDDVDWSRTDDLIAAAGPVVAWT